MFESLTERLTQAFKVLKGQSKLTQENIQPALREVRVSLLEADVALSVAEPFIQQIKEKALGQDVKVELTPDQAFIKIVHAELVEIMGSDRSELNLKTQPPAVFLLAGLQGSGKTTSAAKLSRYLKETEKKKVMLVSTDIYRPAAIEQLKRLAEEVDVAFFPSNPSQKPIDIAKAALQDAKKQAIDVLIVDTAGRLHVDNDMMIEIKALKKAVDPIETLFVIDSMTGFDAVNTAKAFHEALDLTGVILTKTDGDARGGAALSAKKVTGQPIKFIGTGEKTTALEPFYPERIASRILGMGDILSLIEEVERHAGKKSNEHLAKKLKKGKSFDLEDFRSQLIQMSSMGGISSMISKLPGLNKLPTQSMAGGDKTVLKTIAIINSMTRKERRIPKIIIGSRKRRIAEGSGTQIQDVNRLLKQFEQMQKMMKKFNKPGSMGKMMSSMKAMKNFNGLMPGDF